MIIDGINPSKQKQNIIFSYTMAGMILSYLQESNIPEDNGCDNMLIDGIKIEKKLKSEKKVMPGNAMISFTKRA